MKIYTRSGDRGETSLYRGGRVSKAHPRVAAYGGIDELNAQLGFARSLDPAPEVADILRHLQMVLFTLGADLATPPEHACATRIEASDTAALEAGIDRMQAVLPPLRHFILPGGTRCGSAIHVARGLCRRSERDIAALPAGAVRPETLEFVNRLSDHLFVLARYQNFLCGTEEEKWVPGAEQTRRPSE